MSYAHARVTLAAGLVALMAAPAVAATNGDTAAQQGFSVATLHGSYASRFSGEIDTGKAWIPILGTGVFVADGSGHLSGRETYMVGTQVCTATIAGTYAVASDGTGSDAITYKAEPGCEGGSYTQSLAIGRHGELVLLVNTNAGNRIEEEWHSQR
ncbi:MAG TPA: hypothetical protein VMA37_11885 [Acetobacteraceae bacterium]|nr:hypothetical protein [Acetobacteraceae bacterium]